ncbi:hypothetical protein [Streptomyces sp. NPDC048385]|uniref:hypothetical protein n=1 Tax=unclassified Streptomyces TaxID=2593676 RepID=UPI00341714BD
MSTELGQVDLAEAELVEDGDASAGGTVAAYDQATAVLDVLETKAAEELHASRPHKIRTGYARDWVLWGEFHGWLAEQRGPPTGMTGRPGPAPGSRRAGGVAAAQRC